MRKVLSFVLVLALVLSSFSMAFAASPNVDLSDISGNANEEAINVAYNLGIVTGNPDGTYLPEKAVNRAEFAAMITRALGIPETALAGYTASSFKDTTGYGWAVPYLAFCESKGIMLGDGAGNAMPGRTINTNEAMTMVLRAIGYTANSADLVGVWPSNYVTKAQDLGLYTDVAPVVNVDKANAAQIVYNILPIQKVSVASDGKTTAIEDLKLSNGERVTASMLTTGLNCTYEKGVVGYNESSVINIMPYVGAWAEKYLNKDGEIVAVKGLSTFMTGKITKDGEFKVDGVEYTVGSNVRTTIAGFINAKSVSNAAFSTYAQDTDTTFTIAADVTGKTLKDIYSISQWTVSASEQVDKAVQEEIADKKLLNESFAKNDEKEIDTTKFNLVGVDSLDKIAEDNIVYVYTYGNEAKKDIVKVSVGTEVVEGTVTAWNTSDEEATINGKVYANSDVATDSLGADNVSQDVKVWLDAAGDVYTFEVTKGQANNYAVVTGELKDSGSYDKIIRMLTADGNEKTYTVDKDAADGKDAVKGEIVAYGLDKNGVVDGLKATSSAMAGPDCFLTNAAFQVKTARTLYAGGHSFVIDSNVAVFTFDSSDNSYAVSSIGKVKDDVIGATSGGGVYFDKNEKVVAIVVPADSASKSDDSLYGVVNTLTYTVNADNDKCYRVEGFANGAALDKLTTSKSKGEEIKDAIHATDLVLFKLGVDSDGAISKVETVVAIPATQTANVSYGGFTATGAGVGYVEVTSGGGVSVLPLAKDVKYYQVTMKDNNTDIDTYSVFNGSVRAGYQVWFYDFDKSGDDGFGIYDVVIVRK